MRVVDLRGRLLTKRGYQELLPRAPLDIDSALTAIAPILESVKQGNESTLKELSMKFDGVEPDSLRVPTSIMESALANLDPQLREIIIEAIRRVRIVHRDRRCVRCGHGVRGLEVVALRRSWTRTGHRRGGRDHPDRSRDVRGRRIRSDTGVRAGR